MLRIASTAALAATKRSTQGTVAALSPAATTLRCLSTLTGTVKFYARSKAFGFIIPDEGMDVQQDVFVHRNNLVGATDEQPASMPFLRAHERVQFELETTGDGKLVAKKVLTEDGTPVPLYRPIHVQNVQNGIKRTFGMAAYDILDNEDMDEAEKVTRIMEEFQKSKENIDDLAAKRDAELAATGKMIESPEEAV